jgi:hypothetical protein
MVERDFLWQKIQDAMALPEQDPEQKIMKTRFVISLFRELNILNEAMPPGENETDAPQAYTIAGRIGPNMLKLFEEKREVLKVVQVVGPDNDTDENDNDSSGADSTPIVTRLETPSPL